MANEEDDGVKINLISSRKLDSMTSQEKLRFILDEVKKGCVLVLERGLTAEEEINLIKSTMSEINHQTFIGIEMQSYTSDDLATKSWLAKLLGRTQVPKMSVIGPANLLKTIHKNGSMIQAMILTGQSIVSQLPEEEKSGEVTPSDEAPSDEYPGVSDSVQSGQPATEVPMEPGEYPGQEGTLTQEELGAGEPVQAEGVTVTEHPLQSEQPMQPEENTARSDVPVEAQQFDGSLQQETAISEPPASDLTTLVTQGLQREQMTPPAQPPLQSTTALPSDTPNEIKPISFQTPPVEPPQETVESQTIPPPDSLQPTETSESQITNEENLTQPPEQVNEPSQINEDGTTETNQEMNQPPLTGEVHSVEQSQHGTGFLFKRLKEEEE